ncbi:hypothetical protein BGZ83_003647 [Gryganskiella cystojenkinii]|nr:hypothetical protein BGZ83_003647 [Gryganskiella cystojenkinii]
MAATSTTQSGTTTTTEDDENETPPETDPSNRYQRCEEILGEGAYKVVYRACDLEEGNEVAWNQLRFDHLSKREAAKILSEIGILQSIRNDHIINFYASWAASKTTSSSSSSSTSNGGTTAGERIIFVTELMSSGTLKQYLKKTLKGALKPKVVKSWCRQILLGLAYLHTQDPPIIHRDLKCDNIFINGNNGQLKIGDLGLAVVRHRTHVSSVLGTPEFMAPELYDEKYDEKVDIYAFGMCVLEMVTKDYPYSECTNQAQIYRKVSQGIKPQALEHVQDLEIRAFIDRCLDHDPTTRPSAQELLDSEFLAPCAILPASGSDVSSMGLLQNHHHQSQAALDHQEILDSSRTNSATSTSISLVKNASVSSISIPASINKSSQLSVPGKPSSIPSRGQFAPLTTAAATTATTTPQLGTIPMAEFTLTTVDVDNKTYHIRSNLLPSNSPSVPPSPRGNSAFEGVGGPLAVAGAALTTIPTATDVQHISPPSSMPTHSHGPNSKMCSIQVVQYGEAVGDRLNLKMVCTCPVANPTDLSGTTGTHEIKFPFDLGVDTVEEVIAEMIREQILSGDDRGEAMNCIRELVENVLLNRAEQRRQLEQQQQRQQQAKKRQDEAQRRASSTLISSHSMSSVPISSKNEPTALLAVELSKPTSTTTTSPQAIALKKPHHRQLKVPPASDWSQYESSPSPGGSPSSFDQLYPLHPLSTSSGSLPTSLPWMTNSMMAMAANVDQFASAASYAAAVRQPPPVVTESTFPPLQATTPRSRAISATEASLTRSATYSDAVQTPLRTSGIYAPLSVFRNEVNGVSGGVRAASASPRPKSVHDLNYRASHIFTPESLLKIQGGNTVVSRSMELLKEKANDTLLSKKKEDDDVGYTSPYRHGVSSSSINGHLRSPSCDIKATKPISAPPKMLSIPNSLRIFSPPENRPAPTLDFKVAAAAGPLNVSASLIDTTGHLLPLADPAPLNVSLAGTTTPSEPIIAQPRSVELPPIDSSKASSDSGISSGASSPATMTHLATVEKKTGPIVMPGQPDMMSLPQLSGSATVTTVDVDDEGKMQQSGFLLDSLGMHTPPAGQGNRVAPTADEEHLISSEVPVMTSEAKKKIELWSDHVQKTRDSVSSPPPISPDLSIHDHPHLHGEDHGDQVAPQSSTSSPLTRSRTASAASGTTKEEVEEDDDLKILREQQRRELEWMRLQHEMQLQEMIKLKEQKDKEGLLNGHGAVNGSDMIRQTSGVGEGSSYPLTIMDSL